VQVHCDEGVATRIGPESCAGVREDVGEALTGEHTGQPSSRERKVFRVSTRFQTRKATRRGAPARAPRRPGVVVDPGMYGRSLHGNREISSSTTRNLNGVVRIGKARSHSR
jgi:hypothetical protein